MSNKATGRQQRHNERKRKSFIDRYGMTPAELRELKKTDKKLAHEIREKAQQRARRKTTIAKL